MKIVFIYPSMGEQEKYKFRNRQGGIKTWCLEPLPIATLAGLTPKKWKKKFFDDRIEDINYDENCDLVAITVETYTAKRAYEISGEFRSRGKKVILGGFHPSILPEEAEKYADSIMVGEAEDIWNMVLDDVKKKDLKKIYHADELPELSKTKVDRSIFEGKSYFPFTLIESGRGCRFSCDFCSVSLFFKHKFRRRPIKNIIEEIRDSKKRRFMFVDDNICADISSAKKLFAEMIPLKVKWASQASVNIVHDDELLDLMKRSGCIGLLIGFESINKKNIVQMNKGQNIGEDYDLLIKKLGSRNIRIYSSFVFGYDFDTVQSIKKTVEYAIKSKFFIANFYQLTPFPGTKLYDRLKKEKKLLYEKWWLDERYSYGDVVFNPEILSPKTLSCACFESRKKFYSLKSIFSRSITGTNFRSLQNLLLFWIVNIATRKEALKRQARKLGRGELQK